MNRRTDTEVMDLLRGQSDLNKARAIFSGEAARIEQAGQQRRPLSPVEMRRMEFEAIDKIAAALPVPAQLQPNAHAALIADCELYAKVISGIIVVADDWKPGDPERIEPRNTLLKAAAALRSVTPQNAPAQSKPEAAALIEAAIDAARASKTALGYDATKVQQLGRFTMANWKHIEKLWTEPAVPPQDAPAQRTPFKEPDFEIDRDES